MTGTSTTSTTITTTVQTELPAPEALDFSPKICTVMGLELWCYMTDALALH